MNEAAFSARAQFRWTGIVPAMLIGIGFLAVCALRVSGDFSTGMVTDAKVLRSTLAGSIWGTALAKNIGLFGLTHLLLAAASGIVCWLMALVSEVAWPAARLSRLRWILAWAALFAFWVLTANATFYPWSALGEAYAQAARANLFGVTPLHALNAVAGGLLVATVGRAAAAIGRHHRGTGTLRFAVAGLATLGVAALAVNLAGTHASAAAAGDARRPNVIIIGIDSLRADVTRQGWGASLTPNIDRFLQTSVTFTDAITPLARTFPSWVATLTGRHPHTTGAIINLLEPSVLKTGETLPQALRKAGYHTLYGIDEVRFSNLDESYGFDQMITPRMGASDFLLGPINDTPLSNLLVNTRIGKWLFPYSHGNRAVAATYDPETYVARIRRELPRNQPLFAAIHMTLPHWPYYWADAELRYERKAEQVEAIYRQAVQRADEQFGKIYRVFEEAGLLENAIVIVMSDHGEAVGVDGDFPYTTDTSSIIGMTKAGHGSSVLAPDQYQVLLALRMPAGATMRPAAGSTIAAPVSLVDLTPTLLDLLRIRPAGAFDGHSLVPLMAGQTDAPRYFAGRIRFTETEFNPRGFQPGTMLTTSAINLIGELYRVDRSSDRILVKSAYVPMLMNDRQYAAILGDRVMAALPNADGHSFRIVTVPRQGGIPLRMVPAMIEALDPAGQRVYAELLRHLEQAVPGVLISSAAVEPVPAAG